MTKRFIDFTLALIGIILTLPFLPLIALMIKLDSPGTVFYCCDRIGKHGTRFKMYKFRTMYDMLVPIGDSISPEGDPRVTPFGRILRRTKLNEFPQLINILKGEMSFVGPRPEAPDLAALYPLYAREIFTVKPGLVGPNQILGRNEEEWYPEGVDPQQYYLEAILPQKLPIDLAYLREASTLKDLKYIALGIRATIFKSVNLQRVLQNRAQLFLLGTDVGLSMLSFGLALVLQFEGLTDHHSRSDFLQLLLVVVLIRVSCFFYFSLYSRLIRYFSFADMLAVLQGVSSGSILVALLGLTPSGSLRTLSPSALVIDWLGLLVFMLSVRIAVCFMHERRARQRCQAEQMRRVLIFGAGDAGALAYQFLMTSKTDTHDVVGFLDDDVAKRYKTLYGKRVLGNRFNLEALVKLYRVHEVLLALPSASAQDIAAIVQACQCAEVPYRFFSTLQADKRRLHIGELLEMRDLSTDTTTLRQIFEGKRVLLAGAGGAFSLELCRQLLCLAPQQLIILERYETYLTDLVTRLEQTCRQAHLTPILCPLVDHDLIEDVFLNYKPDIVLHNAMRKYPPFLPFQRESIIRSNYLMTFAMAKHAALTGCSHFVLVSSEEANNRGNLIADSLRAVEIGLRQFFAPYATRLSVTRMCNILENRDGVIGRLEDQMRNRETIVLPDREVRCSVLTVQSAVHFLLDTLVQLDRLNLADGIFVCPYASSLRLVDVVQKLAWLNGLEIDADVTVYVPCDSPESATAGGRARVTVPPETLLMTENPGIQLLKQPALSTSQEAMQAVQALLNFDEQDFSNNRWERPTHTLLCLESPL
jgi:FlaA1/EpsC-like NDP-sugar epimerase/lipopolysaccharide/colanic/teichoic acid biosynthesis glycosyltransferase